MCRDGQGRRIPVREQAKALKLSERHTYRMVTQPNWDSWNVAHAENWCRVCGWDFWSLDSDPQRLRQVDWRRGDRRTDRGLAAIFQQAGLPAVKTKLRQLADAILA
jgi:hypothetical protein